MNRARRLEWRVLKATVWHSRHPPRPSPEEALMRDFNDHRAGSVPSPDFLSALQGFLSKHRNGLARVISGLGNRNARTALEDLEMEIEKTAPDQDSLRFLLEILQEFLLEPPRSALDGFPVPPDLDAAVRWHLSKLSDLLSVRRT